MDVTEICRIVMTNISNSKLLRTKRKNKNVGKWWHFLHFPKYFWQFVCHVTSLSLIWPILVCMWVERVWLTLTNEATQLIELLCSFCHRFLGGLYALQTEGISPYLFSKQQIIYILDRNWTTSMDSFQDFKKESVSKA